MVVKMDISMHEERIPHVKLVMILSVVAWVVMITGIHLMLKLIT